MEKFKSITGKNVRIASTSGHVVIVGPDFVAVPDDLAGEAMAAGLLPESIYNEAKKAAEGELAGSGSLKTELDAEKKSGILAALAKINDMVNSGVELTPNGNKLVNRGKPVLSAVSEFCGFEVKTADVEAALSE